MRKSNILKQFVLTPDAGKRLIAKSFVYIPEILRGLKNQTIVIMAGTTNGYIAQEVLQYIKQADGFSNERFYRGVTLPPSYQGNKPGTPVDDDFPGDVVIGKGIWNKGKTIFDVYEQLDKGDIIIKGANALDVINRKAGVLIGHPKGGTVYAAMQAVIGKRAVLYIPIGLEKRVHGNIDDIAARLNSPEATGPRLMPIRGTVVTELDAIRIITGATAELVSAGGICGAEGCCYIAVSGTEEQVSNAQEIIKSVSNKPVFSL